MSKSATMANMTTLSRELPLSRGSSVLQSKADALELQYESLLSSAHKGRRSDPKESREETIAEKISQHTEEAIESQTTACLPITDHGPGVTDLSTAPANINEERKPAVGEEDGREGVIKQPQSESGASYEVSQATPSQNDCSALYQTMGLPVSSNNLSGQDSCMQSLPSCTSESEPRRIRAFAKLEFDDGQFYMNTYSVELGRDRRAAGRAKMEAGFLSRKGSSLGDIPPLFDQARNISNGNIGLGQLSDSGGIVAHDDLEKRHALRRKKSKKSRSTSSSSRLVSRKNSMVYPEVQTDYPPVSMLPPGKTTSKAPPDISALLPPPDECPFVPIQPPNGARHQVISRQHLKINYNSEKQGFDMLVIGRNGAFHDGEWRAPGEVQSLHDGSIIQIGGTQIKFILPELERRASREDNEDSVSGKMSFQFENDRGERITMSNSESSEVEALESVSPSEELSESGMDSSSNESGDDEADEEDEEEEIGEDHEGGSEEAEEVDDFENQGQHVKRTNMIHSADLDEERVHTRAMRRQSKPAKSSSAADSRPGAKVPRKLRLTLASQDSRIQTKTSKNNNKLAVTERKEKILKQKKHHKSKAEKSEVPRENETAEQVAQSNEDQTCPKSDNGNQPPVANKIADRMNNNQEHPYPDLPPGIVIPPRRKGPGRPPKDGFMSKREKALLIRQAKEAEKSRKLGLVPGQLPTSAPKVVSIEKRKYTKRRLEAGSTQIDARPDQGADSDADLPNDFPQEELRISKPTQPIRSPSPEMKESDYTEEQLQRPNANYVILIHDAIKDSKLGEMNLQQIYHAIERRYPFYRFKVSTTGWQSSVRHNLQQNEAFVKIRREGKGYVWGVNPNVTVEKEKRKRISPPPQHRPYYHGYSATRPYGLHQNPNLSQQGLYASQSQAPAPYPPSQILLPPQLPGASRTSTYSSPYAPLRRPQPQPSNIQQLPQATAAQPQFHSPYHSQTGPSSLIAQKNTIQHSPNSLASSILKTQQTIRQSGIGMGALASHAASTSNNIGLLSSKSSSGNSNSQSPSLNSPYQAAAGLKHLPPDSLMTVMADFRQRFLGANEQSARSESIIDPIIRRFTHPKEPHDPPKPHENIIIRIIEGMLKEMQSNKIEEDSRKISIPNGQIVAAGVDRPPQDQSTPANNVTKDGGTNEKSQPLDRQGKSDARSAAAAATARDEKHDASQGASSPTVANGLLDSLASAAAASSATIVKSTPSNVTSSVARPSRENYSAPLAADDAARDKSSSSLSSSVSIHESPAADGPEAGAERLKAEDKHEAESTKGSKRSIDEVTGNADEASSDPDEKAAEPKKIRP